LRVVGEGETPCEFMHLIIDAGVPARAHLAARRRPKATSKDRRRDLALPGDAVVMSQPVRVFVFFGRMALLLI